MPRELLIFRHAKSDWDTDAPTDFDRPLAARGRRDAPRMGAWMQARDLIPDHVVSSPAKRAEQTLRLVLDAIDLATDAVAWDEDLYGATAAGLLGKLADCPAGARRVLLVGHNPGLEELVEHLAGRLDAPPWGKSFPTAALAHFVMPDDWTRLPRGCAELVSLTRPKTLPAGS